jgi:GDP-4-dehydro-6-deoxy-D-mannose reductase
MRILVTGARSFTARHLLPRLEGRGEILGTDLKGPEIGGLRLLPADITDAGAIVDVIREARPDLILHLAGVSGAKPDLCMAVNLEGTRNVFRALNVLATAPRVLCVSSAAVYGRIRPDETPVNESTPLRPAGPYGESKAKAEQVARDAHNQGLARVVIVRPFNLVGPGLPQGLAPSDFAAQVLRVKRGDGDAVVRVGALTPIRDFVDVRDAARAYLLVAEHPDAYGKVWNVGRGEGTSIGDLLERLLRLAGVTPSVETDTARLRAVDVPEMVADVGALTRLVSWRPEIALDQSLVDLLQSG